jgi:Lon protease-like protein
MMPDELPLFPLPDHVLLPGVPVPFRIFEPRYRTLVADLQALPQEQRWLAVPRLIDGHARGPLSDPAFIPVAAAARLLRCKPLDDGQLMIVVEGIARCRLEERPSLRPYRCARCILLPDEIGSEEAARLAADEVLAKVRVLARRLGDGAERLAEMSAGEYHVLTADRLAAILINDLEARQRHLENRDIADRLVVFARLLAKQLGPASGVWDFSRN